MRVCECVCEGGYVRVGEKVCVGHVHAYAARLQELCVCVCVCVCVERGDTCEYEWCRRDMHSVI